MIKAHATVHGQALAVFFGLPEAAVLHANRKLVLVTNVRSVRVGNVLQLTLHVGDIAGVQHGPEPYSLILRLQWYSSYLSLLLFDLEWLASCRLWMTEKIRNRRQLKRFVLKNIDPRKMLSWIQ